ncbi:MAG TPA: response regulator [Gammaproteobacteria bacterium]|nr:response regulator [Gammaproteobacteria bacterium]
MSEKILMIVDDSKVSRMMLTAQIKQLKPDLQLIEAENAEDAVAKLQGKQIDYFSVDLNMPGKNGLELIADIKPEHPNAKFALLTANIQEGTHKKSEELGVCCVNKPITEESVGQLMDYFYG